MKINRTFAENFSTKWNIRKELQIRYLLTNWNLRAVRDLRVYAESLDGKVYHYRDKNNLECDAVVHLRNGSYGLIEIKIGGAELIKDGAESLKKLSDKIDTTRMKKPSFLMVLTGIGDYAYKRPEDGVLVVPIGCLRN